MHRNYRILSFSLLLVAALTAGCGGRDSADAAQSGVAKEEVCSLITTKEASALIGQAVHDGKRDPHEYPNASSCIWTSVDKGLPVLILTYFQNASSHTLDYYAPVIGGYTTEPLGGLSGDGVAVLTSEGVLAVVIMRSGRNAVLLTAPYQKGTKGDAAWNAEINLADIAARRAKSE